MATTTEQRNATKPELRFCSGSNPAHGVSEIWNGENHWKLFQLGIKRRLFLWSTIPQKQSHNSKVGKHLYYWCWYSLHFFLVSLAVFGNMIWLAYVDFNQLCLVLFWQHYWVHGDKLENPSDSLLFIKHSKTSSLLWAIHQ